MNKTIIININGIIFHIEEDAYEVLKKYMTDVKRHFMDSADSLEITTDIENRIAEMFSEVLNAENKQVIIEQDVNAVIGKMGTVADFASAQEEDEGTARHNTPKYHNINRRLFRDGEDQLAGGVCAGIANYFNIQPVWIRLLFFFTFFFFGTGLLLYIILWIIIPKAITRADRMAMKGERLDLHGFKQNFEDELKSAGGHAANLRKEIRPLIYKTRDFAGGFFEHLGNFLRSSGRILLKLIGVALILGGIGLTVGLLVSIYSFLIHGDNGLNHLFPFSMIDYGYTFPFVMAGFLVLQIPLLVIILLSAGILLKRTAINRPAGAIIFIIWLTAFASVLYYSFKIAADFRAEGKINQIVNIKPNASQTYYLKLNDVRYLSKDDSARLDFKHNFIGQTIVDDGKQFDDDIAGNYPSDRLKIIIERSDALQPALNEYFTAKGRDYTDALMNAHNIFYRFIQQDSVLIFDRHIERMPNTLWRDQKATLVLKMPLNAKLVIERHVERYLDGISVYDCGLLNKDKHPKSATFIMTDNGLQCNVDTLVAKPDALIEKP